MLRKLIRQPIVLLLLIGSILYLPSLSGPFFWDDEQFIYKNQFVHQFDLTHIFTQSTTAGAGVVSNYYRPLTSISFALDYQIWHNHPFGYHLTNLCLHVSAAILLFLFLKSLTKRERFSWWISFIFLIHPLQTEAVAYINSRGDSFYALLTFLGLWLWTKSLRQEKTSFSLMGFDFNLPNWLTITLAVISFGLSILAKEIALATSALWCFVTVYLLLEQPKFKKRYLKLSLIAIGFLSLLSLVYLKLRLSWLHWGNVDSILQAYPIAYSHLGVRLLTFSKIIFIYLRLIIIPFPLHMERSVSLVTNPFSFFPLLFVVSQLALVYFAFKEWRLNKTIFIIGGWCWFVSMLVPVSGIIPTNGLIYEHWLYLPLIGFFIMLYGLLKLIVVTKPQFRLFIGQAISLALTLIVPIYLVMTLYQIHLWTHPIAFYQHTLKYAQSARLWNNLGMEYANRGHNQQALLAYKQALSINPHYAQIQHNLGQIYLGQKRWKKAAKYYQQAIKLNKYFLPSYPPLIVALRQDGEKNQACQVLERFTKLSHNRQVINQLKKFVPCP